MADGIAGSRRGRGPRAFARRSHSALERRATRGRGGVSRATLGRRFVEFVGESLSAYLTRWRLHLAARRLRTTDDSIGKIARSVGYTSEYAFSRAFARAWGAAPGRFRREEPT
jgi:AraC-like DNA-binding protein